MSHTKNALQKTISTNLTMLEVASGLSLDVVVASCPAIKSVSRLREIFDSKKPPSVCELVDLCNLFDANVDAVLFEVSSSR